MITRRRFLGAVGMGTLSTAIFGLGRWKGRALAGTGTTIKVYSVLEGGYVSMKKVDRLKEEWKRILTPEQYRVLRGKGTEGAFTGAHWDRKEKGIYRCAGCGLDLFSSASKFESGTGWPSFWMPVAPENVEVEEDRSHLMVRTEVQCARCGGHLGHVFKDGPEPTGLRYCINSVSLDFVTEDALKGSDSR